MNFVENIRLKWRSLTWQQKRYIRYVAIGVAMLGAAWFVSDAVRKNKEARQQKPPEASQTILLSGAANLRAQDLEAELRALQDNVRKLQGAVANAPTLTNEQIAAFIKANPALLSASAAGGAQGAIGGAGGAGLDEESQKKLEALQAQIAALQAQVAAKGQAPIGPVSLPTQHAAAPVPAGAPFIYEITGDASSNKSGSATPGPTGVQQAGGSSVPPPPGAPSQPGAAGPVPPPRPPEKAVSIDASAPKDVMQGLGRLGGQPGEHAKFDAKVSVNDPNRLYLPPGTIITGVTMNGVNVGTGPAARSNPQIVEVRVKKNAIMPNGFQVNLENCQIIATGYGDLSARRVHLRPTVLSCVNPRGAVIESAIKGFVVGDDGIAGMRGVVISHQGELLEKGVLAGFIGGIGSSFAPQPVSPLAINPGSTTQYQYPSASAVIGNGVAGGAGNAATLVAKYYIEQAQQLTPTLQVNPGTSVDIVLEHGATIEKKGMTHAELQKVAYEVRGSQPGAAAPTPQQQAQATLSKVPGATATETPQHQE
jgi:conjugal transfer pilus assembly protein TraB